MPGAADRDISPPGRDPYPRDGKLRCVFAGTIYGQSSQPEANRTLLDKLNQLGTRLGTGGARLWRWIVRTSLTWARCRMSAPGTIAIVAT